MKLIAFCLAVLVLISECLATTPNQGGAPGGGVVGQAPSQPANAEGTGKRRCIRCPPLCRRCEFPFGQCLIVRQNQCRRCGAYKCIRIVESFLGREAQEVETN